MIHAGPQKHKKGLKLNIKKYYHSKGKQNHSIDYEVKQIFIGHNTLFSVLGSVVGGILVGRTLWEYSSVYLGLPLTLSIGLLIFIFSGVILKTFHK